MYSLFGSFQFWFKICNLIRTYITFLFFATYGLQSCVMWPTKTWMMWSLSILKIIHGSPIDFRFGVPTSMHMSRWACLINHRFLIIQHLRIIKSPLLGFFLKGKCIVKKSKLLVFFRYFNVKNHQIQRFQKP